MKRFLPPAALLFAAVLARAEGEPKKLIGVAYGTHPRQVLDFYRQNPGAIDTLRAPIFEDKVIDFIVELAKIGERKITPEELLAMPEAAGEDAVPS